MCGCFYRCINTVITSYKLVFNYTYFKTLHGLEWKLLSFNAQMQLTVICFSRRFISRWVVFFDELLLVGITSAYTTTENKRWSKAL